MTPLSDVMKNHPSNKAKVDASFKVTFYAPEIRVVYYVS